MAVLQVPSTIFSCCSSSSAFFGKNKATLYNPNASLLSKLPFKTAKPLLINIKPKLEMKCSNKEEITEASNSNSMVLHEMYAIMDTVADRAEMHDNIGEQRDNWNCLLLSSVNGMTGTAATMAGIATVVGGGVGGATFMGLKLSSTLLYIAATCILLVMNKIQPSQLAEEQRNASRLFKQLHEEMKTKIAVGNPNSNDVKNAMERLLALDEAYPLPLLDGAMLDKFPSLVKPAVWWPPKGKIIHLHEKLEGNGNGWDENLEMEMKEISGFLKRKDTEEYVKLSKLVLKVNKILAICGPLFTATAAICSLPYFCGSFAAISSVVFGAMAIIVNSLEHGGQIGMVFEMYRSSAGYFRFMGENIDSTLEEKEAEERENGELFEVKVALQLGRSLPELKELADDDEEEEFASKLF